MQQEYKFNDADGPAIREAFENLVRNAGMSFSTQGERYVVHTSNASSMELAFYTRGEGKLYVKHWSGTNQTLRSVFAPVLQAKHTSSLSQGDGGLYFFKNELLGRDVVLTPTPLRESTLRLKEVAYLAGSYFCDAAGEHNGGAMQTKFSERISKIYTNGNGTDYISGYYPDAKNLRVMLPQEQGGMPKDQRGDVIFTDGVRYAPDPGTPSGFKKIPDRATYIVLYRLDSGPDEKSLIATAVAHQKISEPESGSSTRDKRYSSNAYSDTSSGLFFFGIQRKPVALDADSQAFIHALDKNAFGEVYVCEGWATGASIHEATGKPVLCAMDTNGLVKKIPALCALNPGINITFVADNDCWKKDGVTPRPLSSNAGVKSAIIAARRARLAGAGKVSIALQKNTDAGSPENGEKGGSDVNDVLCYHAQKGDRSAGLERARAICELAIEMDRQGNFPVPANAHPHQRVIAEILHEMCHPNEQGHSIVPSFDAIRWDFKAEVAQKRIDALEEAFIPVVRSKKVNLQGLGEVNCDIAQLPASMVTGVRNRRGVMYVACARPGVGDSAIAGQWFIAKTGESLGDAFGERIDALVKTATRNLSSCVRAENGRYTLDSNIMEQRRQAYKKFCLRNMVGFKFYLPIDATVDWKQVTDGLPQSAKEIISQKLQDLAQLAHKKTPDALTANLARFGQGMLAFRVCSFNPPKQEQQPPSVNTAKGFLVVPQNSSLSAAADAAVNELISKERKSHPGVDGTSLDTPKPMKALGSNVWAVSSTEQLTSFLDATHTMLSHLPKADATQKAAAHHSEAATAPRQASPRPAKAVSQEVLNALQKLASELVFTRKLGYGTP